MRGTCALCAKIDDLQNSHLIPKWAYRRVAQSDQARSQAPILIENENAVQTNKQTTKYLLCAECELRLSTREDYLARLTRLNNGRISLFDKLTRMGDQYPNLAMLNDDVDAEQISYFAASMLWRCHVMTEGCQLGSYEPKFRQYLLERASFPREAIMLVQLIEESSDFNLRNLASEPASIKVGHVWLHGFLLVGLVFRCFVGKALDQNLQKISLAGSNPNKYVSITKPEECNDLLAAVNVTKKATPRGRLS